MKPGLIQVPRRVSSAELMDKAAKLPPMYTHVAVANTTLQNGHQTLSVVAIAEGLPPLIYDPLNKSWKELMQQQRQHS